MLSWPQLRMLCGDLIMKNKEVVSIGCTKQAEHQCRVVNNITIINNSVGLKL